MHQAIGRCGSTLVRIPFPGTSVLQCSEHQRHHHHLEAVGGHKTSDPFFRKEAPGDGNVSCGAGGIVYHVKVYEMKKLLSKMLAVKSIVTAGIKEFYDARRIV
jgi:hypothetical protein